MDLSSGQTDGPHSSSSDPRPWKQVELLQRELKLYRPELLALPSLLVATKVDQLARPAATLQALKRHLAASMTSSMPQPQGQAQGQPQGHEDDEDGKEEREGREGKDGDGQKKGGTGHGQVLRILPVSSVTGQGYDMLKLAFRALVSKDGTVEVGGHHD